MCRSPTVSCISGSGTTISEMTLSLHLTTLHARLGRASAEVAQSNCRCKLSITLTVLIESLPCQACSSRSTMTGFCSPELVKGFFSFSRPPAPSVGCMTSHLNSLACPMLPVRNYLLVMQSFIAFLAGKSQYSNVRGKLLVAHRLLARGDKSTSLNLETGTLVCLDL